MHTQMNQSCFFSSFVLKIYGLVVSIHLKLLYFLTEVRVMKNLFKYVKHLIIIQYNAKQEIKGKNVQEVQSTK